MDSPELSWPRGTIPDDERYPWLVAIMCNALAAQINAKPADDMKAAIKFDLMIHEKYFESEDFKSEGGWTLYPESLKQLYDDAHFKRSKN